MSDPVEPAAGLSLHGITIRARDEAEPLLADFSLAIQPGEVVSVMGASGVGKSTLLAYVAGFIDRRAFEATGRVVLAGRRIDTLPPEQRRLGLLFQDAVLFPHLSVGGNLMFGLPRTLHRSRDERCAAVAQALAEAGLAGFEHRDPATLSGGQRARVALLRTLLAAPHALLLDEPFSKLDSALRAEFRAFVFDHARELRLPTLLVTHDPADMEAAGGRRVHLDPPIS
ncbi:ATP-binding cassette domain-containing protein [Geminicoccus roseus]|uniref:ATP-binding cassette domain-containing protein n=1 Tax=Geminicoccus roseus TaxID=404900 RepID=UPI00048601C7|nr:ATP-binding cassette domain-containing protein [Geminicoccus roseus]